MSERASESRAPSEMGSPPAAVPALGPTPRVRKLAIAERTLANGLHVLAVRRGQVPLVEVRLRVPFQGSRPAHPARATLLAETLLTGTESRSRADLAADLQGLGGSLSASVDADRLLLSGSALATRLTDLLGVVADVLTAAKFPKSEVHRERDRLVERLGIARSQAGVVAHEALEHRMYGAHPYARDLPRPDAVADTTVSQVRTLHGDRVRPAGATLVVVGSLTPARMLDQVEAALSAWAGEPASAKIPKLPALEPGPVVLVDRPGSVQSALRIGGTAVPRDHPDSPALALANLVFGGYFSSRWVENIREDKGYTYSPRSSIDHHTLGSSFTAAADVATEVTGPALLETRYELGRIAALPVRPDEVDAVRQYAIGTLALSIATQAGLASTLSALAGVGLGVDWLIAQPPRLAAVTPEQVSEAAATYLGPSRLVTVVVGDAGVVREPLAALTDLAGG